MNTWTMAITPMSTPFFYFKQIIQYPSPQTMQFNPREQQDSIPVL